MTWIVGTPYGFGYGIGISDVRVTLGDHSEHDCLQKIYPVGRFIAMGFAGSVRIGFAMIETLRTFLYNEDQSLAYDPTAVAQWWPGDGGWAQTIALILLSRVPRPSSAWAGIFLGGVRTLSREDG
jgi:hypothetical protein